MHDGKTLRFRACLAGFYQPAQFELKSHWSEDPGEHSRGLDSTGILLILYIIPDQACYVYGPVPAARRRYQLEDVER